MPIYATKPEKRSVMDRPTNKKTDEFFYLHSWIDGPIDRQISKQSNIAKTGSNDGEKEEKKENGA